MKELKHLDLEIGIISRIENSKYTIIGSSGHKDIHPGMIFNLENTYCQAVVAEKKIISVNNAGHHPLLKTSCLFIHVTESYIAAPIFVRNNIWGTINFSSKMSN